MTVLSNVEIKRRIGLRTDGRILINRRGENFQSNVAGEDIQPCSVDLHLGDKIKVFVGSMMDLDLPTRTEHWWETLQQVDLYDDTRGWILNPGQLYLSSTREWLEIPLDLVGHLTGVSTVARGGMFPHIQAGLLDPGYHGKPTLEKIVVVEKTIVRPGTRICQVYFELLDQPAYPGYRGRYQGDTEPTPGKVKRT
jgi:dCTP deaminase